MTMWDVASAVRRTWYVLAMGLVLTLAGAWAVTAVPGVYWTSTRVVFLAPIQPNRLAPEVKGVLPFVGVVERMVNGDHRADVPTSPEVNLVDQGVRDGWSVWMPDSGGQWAVNFTEATLVVQAAGPTPEAVKDRVSALLAQIDAVAALLQQEVGIAPAARIETVRMPPMIAVRYSGPHTKRALGAAIVLGGLASVTAAVAVDRLRRPGAAEVRP